MPIFEYECTECGERMEHLQLSSGSPLKACPECGAEVRKLMSAPAFQFKGSGWYVTDYAGKGKGQGDGNGTGKKDGDGKSADSGSKSADKSTSSDSSASSSAPDKSKSSSKKTSSPAD